MKKKKVIVLLLSMSLVTGMLSACGGAKQLSDSATVDISISNDSYISDGYDTEEMDGVSDMVYNVTVDAPSAKSETGNMDIMEPDFNTEEYSAVKEEGFKSVAFRIRMQDANATLTDETIESQMANVRSTLKKSMPDLSFRE